jgi:hypothetical protein
VITAPNFEGLKWLVHGFGTRDSEYPAGIIIVKQIHSSIVLDASEIRGAEIEGDALVCGEKGMIVGVKTADCVPILLADPLTRVVAAVHAGWRGTAARIIDATLRELALKWGARPAEVRAAIGPAIGPCCYEVGPEVARRFGICVSEPVRLDLPALNERQLREGGVTNIWQSGECTFCTGERFFSFRRERETAGRMVAFIGINRTGGL